MHPGDCRSSRSGRGGSPCETSHDVAEMGLYFRTNATAADDRPVGRQEIADRGWFRVSAADASLLRSPHPIVFNDDRMSAIFRRRFGDAYRGLVIDLCIDGCDRCDEIFDHHGFGIGETSERKPFLQVCQKPVDEVFIAHAVTSCAALKRPWPYGPQSALHWLHLHR